jgi:2-polyprenyl-6-methoxyphenol hydroxylase-like FAD-dependent oxidoreductase
MGDFLDTTNFGPVAAIYLQSTGLIESFPLPGNKRRWVIRTPAYIENPSVEQLKKWIEPRTGYTLDPKTNTMISSFGVQHYRAGSYGRGRIGIIGDAAHIVSPFGGQGMNLGWMDAWNLAKLLRQHRPTGFRDLPLLQFSRRRNLAAWQAIKRAEFNMGMGRAHPHPELHEAFIKSLMHLPTNWILPRLFTMRWL